MCKKLNYFGTDGFRGTAGKELTAIHAFKIGRFLGWYYSSKKPVSKAKIVIGKDTRLSSYNLEYALASGITSSGADAFMLHVTTTPSVSYVTRTEEFDCGVMITASHNQYYDNGIKILNRFGEKLDDDVTYLIEKYIDGEYSHFETDGGDLPLAQKDGIGKVIDHVSGRNRYVGYLISTASNSYKDMRIGLDCANGAAWSIAKSVFDALGAKTYVIGNTPSGTNINENCGSTHIDRLKELVLKEHLDLGFGFDGDADRCIAVDEFGKTIDGDSMMYILAKRLRSRGMLSENTVVATIMSNSGFTKSLENSGFNTVQTTVGDRFVYECMQKNGFSLGGEQSGHIIIKKYATTGDGILTALQITEEICDKKLPLSKLCEGLTIYPQFTKNILVKDKDNVIGDNTILEKVAQIEKEIGSAGRILLRKSGTEPVIRIMVECESLSKCQEYANIVGELMAERGHLYE